MGLFDHFRRISALPFQALARPSAGATTEPGAATGAAADARLHEAPGIDRKSLDSIKDAAATCQVLAWVVVLLNEAPPTEPAAFVEWTRKIGLQAAGIRVDTEGAFRLGIGKHDATAYVGGGPYPAELLAANVVPPDSDAGRGFIGLSFCLPGQVPLLRLNGASFEPWAVDSQLRALSKIAFELSRHGPAVLVPQARRVYGAEIFRELLGDLDDPKSRPFAAWIGLSVDPRAGRYSSHGMVLHAMPNVMVEVDVNDGWELARTEEAILFACSKMVHTNRELQPGEMLSVPVGQPVTSVAEPLVEGDAEVYVVEKWEAPSLELRRPHGLSCSRGTVALRRKDRAGVRARWEKAPEGREPRVALNSYRELLRHSLAMYLDAGLSDELMPMLEESDLPFGVDVWEARSEPGFFMTSNGIGRLSQRFGEPSSRTDHVELILAVHAHNPLFANLLASIAVAVHMQENEEEVFKPGGTVGRPLPEIGAAGFIMGDAGSISIAKGPMIHLLELIPATRAEFREARLGGSAKFLARIGKMSPGSRAARWKLTRAH